MVNKVSEFPIENTLNDNHKLLGSVLNGDVKNFLLSDLKTFINPNDLTIQPYISPTLNPAVLYLLKNSTLNVTIYGSNFDENMLIDFGSNVTINSINITDKQIDLNLTTADVIQSEQSVIIKRGDYERFGLDIKFELIDNLYGTGPAGTFTTDFESPAGTEGQDLWGSNWALSVYGGINSVDGFFRSSTAGTPSGSTGPSTPEVFGSGNTRYAFFEVSNPNNGAGKYGIMETSYFHLLERIQLRLYMYGAQIGYFKIETQNADDSWTERYSISGQQNSSDNDGTDSALTVDIDCTGFMAKAIRFVTGEAPAYNGDIAIDNIIITSS